MRVAFIFVLWTVITPILLGSISEAAESMPAGCARWRMSGQERTRDGGMTTSYELVCPQENMELSDVELVFISTRRDGKSGEISEIYKKTPSGVDGAYSVEIYSGRSERIVLLAKVRVGEKLFYAKTLLNGYGQSGKMDPEATRIGKLPDWPQLRLAGEEYFYRAQTGTPLDVHIESGPKVDGPKVNGPKVNGPKVDGPQVMHVIENNMSVGTRTLGDAGFYTYTPPHDKTLSRAGYSAKNDLVFVVELEDGGDIVSLHLPIHRAYYGQISLRGGLLVTASSALLCLASVLYNGRRFRWNGF